MPDKSKAQNIAMNMAKAIQAGDLKPKPGTASAGIAQSMKPAALADFGGPMKPGLPNKAPKPVSQPRRASAPAPGSRVTATPTGSLAPVPGTKLGGKK
jgi:hypothetical protein